MNDITLDGCTPTPLASYLKALGVLRLLSSKYPDTRGFWRNDKFVLRVGFDCVAIERFFLCEYVPTPIMAPWNGGSGFYRQERKSKEKDPATGKKKKLGIFDQETEATKVVRSIANSSSDRFAAYRSALIEASDLVRDAKLVTAPDGGKPKDDFVVKLRSLLSDECIRAMDAGMAIAEMKWQASPLLGSGWNDGNLDFTSNFMLRLTDVIGTTEGKAPDQSLGWLQASLYGSSVPNLTKSSIGQFSPGQAGGPNAGTGFEADASINPWDFVLMIEGVLTFAASAVRRNAADSAGTMSFPFTVRAVAAGSGSLGRGDIEKKPRGELWMPLWSQATTYAEVCALMAEGRVALGRKPARDALDFVRAVQHLGGYRGIESFQRFGLLMRSGKAYLATPLSRVQVSDQPQSRWLDDLDKNRWLERFRRFAKGENTPNRFLMLCKRLEDKLFAFSGREPSKAEAQSLLILLGEIQTALSNSQKARETVRPIPELSEHWVIAADDGSSACRIAKALAGLRGADDEPLPLRAQLFPVQRKRDQWMIPDANEKIRFCVGTKGRLVDTLCSLLTHRLWIAEKLEMDKPLGGTAGATLEDINAFLRANMDERIAALMPGFSLCDIPHDLEHSGGTDTMPAAFALLKVVLTPDQALRNLKRKNSPERLLPQMGAHDRLAVPIGMLAQLAAGNHCNRAVNAAWRGLRASGLASVFSQSALPSLQGISPRRAAAALLIPLRYGGTATLVRSVLKLAESNTEAQTI